MPNVYDNSMAGLGTTGGALGAMQEGGSGVASGVMKGLAYQREAEEKKRIEQQDLDYKGLVIGINYMTEGLKSDNPEFKQQATNIFNHMTETNSLSKRFGLKPIQAFTQQDISQIFDMDKAINGEDTAAMPIIESIYKRNTEMGKVVMELRKSGMSIRAEKAKEENKRIWESGQKDIELRKETREIDKRIMGFDPESGLYNVDMGKAPVKPESKGHAEQIVTPTFVNHWKKRENVDFTGMTNGEVKEIIDYAKANKQTIKRAMSELTGQMEESTTTEYPVGFGGEQGDNIDLVAKGKGLMQQSTTKKPLTPEHIQILKEEWRNPNFDVAYEAAINSGYTDTEIREIIKNINFDNGVQPASELRTRR